MHLIEGLYSIVIFVTFLVPGGSRHSAVCMRPFDKLRRTR